MHFYVKLTAESKKIGMKVSKSLESLETSLENMAFLDKILVRQKKYFPGAGAEMGETRGGRGGIMTTLSVQGRHSGRPCPRAAHVDTRTYILL